MDDNNADRHFVVTAGVVICVAFVLFAVNCRYEAAEKHQQVMARMQMPEALQSCTTELQELKKNLQTILDRIIVVEE